MHEFEIKILKGLLGLQIKKIVFSRAIYDFQNPKHITSHEGLVLSFFNNETRKDTDYLHIDPIKGLSIKGSFVFLKYWKYIHKSLKLSLHYPQQNLDSKFRTSFNVSYLGKLLRMSAIARPNLPEGILSFFFENGNVFMVVIESSIYIFLDNECDDETFFKNYFDSSEMIIIANVD